MSDLWALGELHDDVVDLRQMETSEAALPEGSAATASSGRAIDKPQVYSGRSAYLNKCYVGQFADDGLLVSKKCTFCHTLFNQKQLNRTNDALHVIKCSRASYEAKADVAQHCHSSVVQNEWTKFAECVREESAPAPRS